MSANIVTVRPELIDALSSAYLASGYKQDDVILTRLRYDPAFCESTFSVREAYQPGDGHFHLSMTTATNCISQTGIIFAGLLNGLSKKGGEVYILEFNIRFLRAVCEEEFLVSARMDGARRTAKGIIYRMQGEVQKGAFSYEATFLFPFEASVL